MLQAPTGLIEYPYLIFIFFIIIIAVFPFPRSPTQQKGTDKNKTYEDTPPVDSAEENNGSKAKLIPDAHADVLKIDEIEENESFSFLDLFLF